MIVVSTMMSWLAYELHSCVSRNSFDCCFCTGATSTCLCVSPQVIMPS